MNNCGETGHITYVISSREPVAMSSPCILARKIRLIVVFVARVVVENYSIWPDGRIWLTVISASIRVEGVVWIKVMDL